MPKQENHCLSLSVQISWPCSSSFAWAIGMRKGDQICGQKVGLLFESLHLKWKGPPGALNTFIFHEATVLSASFVMQLFPVQTHQRNYSPQTVCSHCSFPSCVCKQSEDKN